jgi:Domain of unknown function (DUF397)
MKISSFCSTDGCIGVGFDAKSTFSATNGGCVSAGAFAKASFSGPTGGNCVEAGAVRKSSPSAASGNCVEAGAFARASFSTNDGQCVEAGAVRKSSFSTLNGSCVETGAAGKSSFSMSNGDCVEAGATRKSSLSGYNGDCVEAGAERRACDQESCIAVLVEGDENCEHSVKVYDTKDRTIPPVEFGLGAWQEFVNQVKGGEFPADPDVAEYRIGHHRFSYGEWDAFVKGCQHIEDNGLGEFDLSPALAAELAAVKVGK